MTLGGKTTGKVPAMSTTYGEWSKTPHGNPCDHYAAGTYEADEVDGVQRCPRCGATRPVLVEKRRRAERNPLY